MKREQRLKIAEGYMVAEAQIAKQAEVIKELLNAKKDEAVGDIGEEITDDAAREEISRLVKDGYTSGHLDDGKGCRTYWRLVMDTWRT